MNRLSRVLVFGMIVLAACVPPAGGPVDALRVAVSGLKTAAGAGHAESQPGTWVAFVADGPPAGITALSTAPDGKYESTTEGKRPGIGTVGYSNPAEHMTAFLYFAVDDGFQIPASGAVTIEIGYLDMGYGPIMLQYDSTEPPQAHAPDFDPAYMPRTLVYRQNTGTWRTISYSMSDARFAKGQNGGADFRLAAFDWALVISHVTITREAATASTPSANAPSPSPAPYPAPLGERAVFTYYFYWYDKQTDSHMSPLIDVPPDFHTMSFRDVEWQKRQLEDAAYARIDTILPVYWYSAGELWWSQPGIEVLAKALEEVRDEGITPPSVGMFLDTTSSKGKDLRLPDEKAAVYANIAYFFEKIPRPYWALAQGNRPIIWAYGSEWPAAYNQSFIDHIYDHFEADFGVRPYLVFEASWTYPTHTAENGDAKITHAVRGGRLQYDASYHWGGAIRFRTTDQITSIGPGFGAASSDGSAPAPADRQNGEHYRDGLLQAIVCPAPWLAIETWNELHEATDIAESLNYGRQYIEMTRDLVPYFKAGQLPAGVPESRTACTLD